MRLLFALALWVSPASAVTLADGRACLDRNDVPCAQAVVDELAADKSVRADELRFASRVAFYGGDFETAVDLVNRASKAGWEDKWDDRLLYERTMRVHAEWDHIERGNFVVAYRPGVDAVLLHDAVEVLLSSEKNYGPILGGSPSGPTRLEIYPDGRSFTDASSLTKENIQTTGVVALSKWSRLLLTSPRALGRGYGWKDTVAHEYIHLVVAHQTDDRAPVWLQEAIAKYLDNRWSDGKDHFKLSVRAQGLLATAIRDDDFVTFDQMHPSFAKLPSADRASLAYAQVATMMAFCFQEGGDDVLLKVFPLLRDGMDAREALAQGSGFKNFADLETQWMAYVQGLDLIGKRLASMPTLLDGGSAIDADPVLSHRQDLARFLRLGDLLAEKERHKAAMVEYTKAVPDDEPMSPLLANRMARSWIALKQLKSAEKVLTESLLDYPEFALTHKTLGALHHAQGSKRNAIKSYRAAADMNPYDPEVISALADLTVSLGDVKSSKRYQDHLRILQRGGEG